jgi:hypothetical protein
MRDHLASYFSDPTIAPPCTDTRSPSDNETLNHVSTIPTIAIQIAISNLEAV